jgi:hypothetical protein
MRLNENTDFLGLPTKEKSEGTPFLIIKKIMSTPKVNPW